MSLTKSELKLKQFIKDNSSSDYDLILAFSGGKDSSYLLYLLSEVLQLKVWTVSMISNFTPKHTISNIRKLATKFSSEHTEIVNDVLNYCGEHFLDSWCNNPKVESLVMLCTGCRIGLINPFIDLARSNKIKTIVFGYTLYEATDYKHELINYPKNRKGFIFFVIGYIRQLILNPTYLKKPKAIWIQFIEFLAWKQKKKKFKQNELINLKPFYDYIKYNEVEISEVLKRIDWEPSKHKTNTWRSDCNMGFIRQILYKSLHDKTDLDNFISKMGNEKSLNEIERDKIIQDDYITIESLESIISEINMSKKTQDKIFKTIKKIAY